MREINEIILHCSATWSKQDIGVKEITQWHTLPEPRGRGWSHIGYHYVIRRDGRLEEGCPLETPGIHCSGHNAKSIGICVVGGGPNGEDKHFTQAQFDMLAKTIKLLRQKYPKTSIHGHNEFANKACPVFSVSKFLEDYGIPKEMWSKERWPHFKPSEFTELWGGGDMPKTWRETLNALERLRGKIGKPLILLRTEWRRDVPMMVCDIKDVPGEAKASVVRKAMDAGFSSARALEEGVRVYLGGNVI